MNPHSFHELLRELMQEEFPQISIRTPVRTGELATPYLLLTCTGEEPLIAGNNTWECTLAVELHTTAYDNPGADSRDMFSRICRAIGEKSMKKSLNERAGDFYVYSLSQRSLDEPSTEDNDFIQRANYRVILQY